MAISAVPARRQGSQRRHAAPCGEAGADLEDAILSMRNFAANQALGYGGTYVTKAPAHVAVLPVGYADGTTGSFPIAGE